ncbi:MAG: 4Fe-4S dicluster domain-containing protein [Bacteroidales bacterium]|nr:4Fe-4S dicluster domain-containing protein [Bacteroidales bacterium]
MKEFGYSLSPSSRVDLDKVDKSKQNRLFALEPGFKKCMSCGSCSATCSAGNYTDVSLRRAISYIQNGQDQLAVNMLRNCMLCGKCLIICPRGINTRNLIRNILNVYGEKQI